METPLRKLMSGLVAAAVMLCGANVMLAAQPNLAVKPNVDFIKKWAQANGKFGKPGQKQTQPKGWPQGNHHPQHWPNHPKFPGPHPWPGHRRHPRPIITPVYEPVIVPVAPAPAEPDMENPAPPADIQLVNPAENGVTLKYRLDDGELQSLPPGSSVSISQATVVSFDRGGAAGQARYSLTGGTYRFVPTGGKWDLLQDADDDGQTGQDPSADANPVPAN
jgi:hypothetical protein